MNESAGDDDAFGSLALNALYHPSLALLTDLYQVTMAQGYWKSGAREKEAAFTLSFRNNPFGGGYTVACGLGMLIGFLRDFRFQGEDLDYLASLRGNDEAPLFEEAFLAYLGDMRLECDIDAVPEGTVVFPNEPMVRVRGPIIQGQILETPLLNVINFQSLIATKAARVAQAAKGEPVLEFGLRRAPGVDGALAASRAAYVGGCAATSNLLAGRLYGIPVRGTHAHSWVMSFADELESFRAYARAMPNNCVFLVDTYDTLQGVRNAIVVGRELREAGYELGGVRLDSGDLAYLSIEARRLLDEAGFEDVPIFASNNLDEHIIESLKDQGATIAAWGVGTKLVTGHDDSALNGVYKLSAVRQRGGEWRRCIKLSEQAAKISVPGVLQVRRYQRDGLFVADAVYDEDTDIDAGCTIVDPVDMTRRKRLSGSMKSEDLLTPVMRAGQLVTEPVALEHSRTRVRQQLAGLHEAIRRFTYPHEYPVGLELHLHEMRTRLILEARGERF